MHGCSEAIILLHVLWAKHTPNSENESSDDREVDNCLEKIHFTDLVKDAKSLACRFYSSQISSQTELCHINTAQYSSKWQLPGCFFRDDFFQDSNYSTLGTDTNM